MDMTSLQGLLQGNSLQPQVGLQNGLLGYAPQNQQIPQMGMGLPQTTMGPWSQVAYQMAGSPHQGGLLQPVPTPPLLPGSGGGALGSSGGSALGGAGLGLLSTLAKNPGLVKNAYNGASSLFGSGTAANAAPSPSGGLLGNATAYGTDSAVAPASGLLASTGTAAGDAALAPVGVDSVSELPSVSSAVDAGASSGGLLGSTGMTGAQALGAVAVPLSIYSEIGNWQSGNTGMDALGGAESGAAVGTAIMPGIGTAIGAIGGALAGALSSAFGPGKVDPENANFEQYTQAFNKTPAAQQAQVAAGVQNPYLPLAGYFDLRSGQLKGQNPIYSTYGRMGEQKFTNDLIGKIQSAQAQGITDPTKVYNSVVQPWINSMGAWNDSNKNAMTGLIQNMTGQILAGTYKQNFKSIGGDQVWK